MKTHPTNEKKLKPTIIIGGQESIFGRHQPDLAAQDIILRAMAKGITDPKELKKLAGLQSIAQVHRTIDKLSIRQEYHRALESHGISMGFIVGELKSIISGNDDDRIRLQALQTVIKSLGLDKYEEQQVSGKDWEQTILAAANTQKEIPVAEYDVIEPKKPDEMIAARKAETQLAKEIYGDQNV